MARRDCGSVLLSKDLRMDRLIGDGMSGEVWQGKVLSANRDVAIKKLREAGRLEDVMDEVRVHKLLEHQYVVRLIGYTDIAPYCLVFEYVPNETLYNALHVKGSEMEFSGTDLTVIAVAVAIGMRYIHSQGVVHRDLKSSNILLDRGGLPKIGDLGISVMENDMRVPDKASTPAISAPEELKGMVVDRSADVYSYGILLWEMATGMSPFAGDVVEHVIWSVSKGERPEIPKGTAPELAHLIMACWAGDPAERPTFSQIVNEFTSGNVMFPGAVRSAFNNYMSAYDGVLARDYRNEAMGFLTSVPTIAKKESDGGTDAPVTIQDVVETLSGHAKDEKVMNVLDVLEENNRIVQQLGQRMWTLLLPLILREKNGKPLAYVWRVIQLLETLARDQRSLEFLPGVPNLNAYVCVDTLDMFLYIVSFAVRVVTPKVVTALEALLNARDVDEDAKDKVVRLFCKILQNLRDPAITNIVIEIMYKTARSSVRCRYGHLAVKCMFVNRETVELDQKLLGLASMYVESDVSANAAVGYQVSMLCKDDPLQISVDDCLKRMMTDDEELRDAVVEFVRRKWSTTDDLAIIAKIVRCALDVYEKYQYQRAALLIFHFADVPKQPPVFCDPEFVGRYLNVRDDIAPDLIQVLVFMMRVNPGVLMHSAIPRYLRSVLKYGDDQQFALVCLFIDRDGATPEFLLSLESCGVLEMMCIRTGNDSSVPVINIAATTLSRFVDILYFDYYSRIIPALIRCISFPDNVGADKSLSLLLSLSKYETLVPYLRNSISLHILAPFKSSCTACVKGLARKLHLK